MSQQFTISIPAGQAVTITANAVAAGYYYQNGNPGSADGGLSQLAAGASAVIGPFNGPYNYTFVSFGDQMTYTSAVVGNYNSASDVANEAATYQPILSGATLTAATVAVGDLLVYQDISDANKIKTATAAAVAALQDISGKAPIASPSFTGTVALPVVTVAQGTPGTESTNAVTVNGSAGVITTSSLTTAAAGSYLVTLTNSAIVGTGSMILASIAGGSNTTKGFSIESICTAASTATITIYNNTAATALNGTIVINFMVI